MRLIWLFLYIAGAKEFCLKNLSNIKSNNLKLRVIEDTSKSIELNDFSDVGHKQVMETQSLRTNALRNL